MIFTSFTTKTSRKWSELCTQVKNGLVTEVGCCDLTLSTLESFDSFQQVSIVTCVPFSPCSPSYCFNETGEFLHIHGQIFVIGALFFLLYLEIRMLFKLICSFVGSSLLWHRVIDTDHWLLSYSILFWFKQIIFRVCYSKLFLNEMSLWVCPGSGNKTF